MIIQVFSNSMIFHAWIFFSDFPGFPWFPELVGTLLDAYFLAKLDICLYES